MKLLALLRATWRGTQFLLHLVLGSMLGGGYRLRYGAQWHTTAAGMSIIRWWMQRLTRLIGIQITQYGLPASGRMLYVANHISFLDICVLSSIIPVRFLAKASVRHWPVIGHLTALSGNLFIQRGKRQQLAPMLASVTQALHVARPLVLFPEGTTSAGTQVLKFHTGLFQAAIDSQTRVQPVTLHYRRNKQVDRLAAYIDHDNFLLTLLRLFAQSATEVHLCFSHPIPTATTTRQQLAQLCHSEISQVLHGLLHKPVTTDIIDATPEFAILGECDG